MELGLIIDILVGVLVCVFGYMWKAQADEIKRMDILLNRTREEFCTRAEVSKQIQEVLNYLHRLDDKLDRMTRK